VTVPVIVVGFWIIARSVIIPGVPAMIVSGPVRSSVIRITPSVGGITPSIISSITPTVIGTVIGIAVGETHSPSRVAPSHANSPAERTSGIPVHIGIVGIVIVPSVITI
jgi:hypothetical protein